jgi:uncharacterized protein
MRTAVAILLLCFGTAVPAARFDCSLKAPRQSEQDKLVWVYADGFLKPAEADRLNAKLVRFARETSNQILLLVVDTLCGLPEADLATEVGHTWGIGWKDKGNGIVLLVKPNGPPGERVVYIAVGYGLEPVVPDVTAKRIVRDEIIPLFQQQRFHDGLDRGTDLLMALAKGEYDEAVRGRERFPWPVAVFMLVTFLIVFFSWRGQVKRYARVNKVDFWTAMWLLSQMQQKHGRGGPMRGGGGFGGLGGGGGFGGFGGGGFGGGGAGGRW